MMDQHAEDHLHESKERKSTVVRREGSPYKYPGSGLSCFTLDTKHHISFFILMKIVKIPYLHLTLKCVKRNPIVFILTIQKAH